MIDQKFPFQAMLHDGTFTNLDFQPGREVVGVGGKAEMSKIRESYYNQLLAAGVPMPDARAKADAVQGAIVLMTAQYLVMGMDRGIVLDDKAKNKEAWTIVARNSRTHIGQRVGGNPDKASNKDRDVRRAYFTEEVQRDYRSVPRVADIADRIGAEMEKSRKQTKA